MNETILKLLVILIPIAVVLLLIGLPLAYSIWRPCWWKTVLITWIIWIAYGFLAPGVATLRHNLTGKHVEIDGLPLFTGVLLGWFFGLIFALIGSTLHDFIQKRWPSVFKT